jgi:hypothetical protein
MILYSISILNYQITSFLPIFKLLYQVWDHFLLIFMIIIAAKLFSMPFTKIILHQFHLYTKIKVFLMEPKTAMAIYQLSILPFLS